MDAERPRRRISNPGSRLHREYGATMFDELSFLKRSSFNLSAGLFGEGDAVVAQCDPT